MNLPSFMLKLAADENFNNDIVRGVLRGDICRASSWRLKLYVKPVKPNGP
jgi:hypothetical protein